VVDEPRNEQQRSAQDAAHEWPGVESLIVLALLRDDRSERWSRAELERELSDIPPAHIDAALSGLTARGVVCRDRDCAWASPCAKHLDALGMICI
jgi:hypothetical protein